MVCHEIAAISRGALPAAGLDFEPGFVWTKPGEKFQGLLVEQPGPHHGTHMLLIILEEVQVQVRGRRKELRACREVGQHPPHSLRMKERGIDCRIAECTHGSLYSQAQINRFVRAQFDRNTKPRLQNY